MDGDGGEVGDGNAAAADDGGGRSRSGHGIGSTRTIHSAIQSAPPLRASGLAAPSLLDNCACKNCALSKDSCLPFPWHAM
eukprot:754757-Hanusia_phi.AAC.1